MHSASFRAAAPAAALALAGLLLSACASSDVAAIKMASQDQIRGIQVSEINVVIATPKPNPQLQTILTEELTEAMPVCAVGQNGHRMEVTITDFEDQDVAKAILIGDEIELKGRVALVEVATGEQIGEYFVERSMFWGGFVGAAVMSDAERQLSESFTESVCEEVFGVKLDEVNKT